MTNEELRVKAKRRKLIIQALIAVLSVIVIWNVISSAQSNLAALGITSGFGFLERGTGWGYSFSLIPRSIDDTYARTLMIGFLNTLFLGVVCIVISTVFGFIIGSVRNASNLALSTVASIYVQIFRNIPLILQLVLWYSVLIHLPGPRQSITILSSVFLSNRGLMIPGLNISSLTALILCILSIALAIVVIAMKVGLLRGLLYWLAGTVAISLIAVLGFGGDGAIIQFPELKGLRFVGGIEVSVELLAMIIAIVLYGSAYIAEVVRGGLDEVPTGLIEAGKALGLSPGTIWSKIKMPMALRTIIPPLGNQWIFIMKATTIGVAIGFSDLFMLVSTSITQSGQTLELIAILMGAFLLINFSLAQLVNWLNASLKLKAH